MGDPWRDPDTLREAYDELGSAGKVADRFGCHKTTVLRWLKEFEIDHWQMPKYDDHPWRDRETLENALNEGAGGSALARRWGCTPATISQWIDRHGITPPEFVRFGTTKDGYEMWRHGKGTNAGCWEVGVHQLLAIAEYGFDEVAGKEVHHINGIPFDNRHENVIPLTKSQHSKLHREEENDN